MIAKTIREQVTERIRNDLITGRIPTGSPLREQELAEQFGVSRGPVRDAFLQLTNEGFLAYQANCGVTVRTAMVGAERTFVMSLRRQIEEYVIRRGLSKLSEDDFRTFDEILDRMREACRRKDVTQLAQCDMEFHQAILHAAGGDEFLSVWKLLCMQMLLEYSRVKNWMQVHQEHVAIVNSLRDGKIRGVLKSLKENLK